MRDVINISLPPNLTRVLKKAVKEGGYASKSEFFRHLIRQWEENTKLYEAVLESESEFKAGKGIKLTSLKSLR